MGLASPGSGRKLSGAPYPALSRWSGLNVQQLFSLLAPVSGHRGGKCQMTQKASRGPQVRGEAWGWGSGLSLGAEPSKAPAEIRAQVSSL